MPALVPCLSVAVALVVDLLPVAVAVLPWREWMDPSVTFSKTTKRNTTDPRRPAAMLGTYGHGEGVARPNKPRTTIKITSNETTEEEEIYSTTKEQTVELRDGTARLE